MRQPPCRIARPADGDAILSESLAAAVAGSEEVEEGVASFAQNAWGDPERRFAQAVQRRLCFRKIDEPSRSAPEKYTWRTMHFDRHLLGDHTRSAVIGEEPVGATPASSFATLGGMRTSPAASNRLRRFASKRWTSGPVSQTISFTRPAL